MGQKRGQHEHQGSGRRPWTSGRVFSNLTRRISPSVRREVTTGNRDCIRQDAKVTKKLVAA